MLILTRRPGESIQIDSTKASATNGGEPVTVTVLGVKGNQVRVGLASPNCRRQIAAPDDVTILREELIQDRESA